MKHSAIIVWFRNDLRLHDHEALYRACKNAERIIPVYILDPRVWENGSFGFIKTGQFRTQFLLQSLDDLAVSLRKLGTNLVVRQGYPEELLPEMTQEFGAEAIYAHKEATVEEIQVEQRLEDSLFARGKYLELFWGSTLFHLEDLPMPLSGLPPVFTHFRKEVERMSRVRECFPLPKEIPGGKAIPNPQIPSLESLIGESGANPLDTRSAFPFKGGECQGLMRLHAYLWENNAIQTYKETRNGLLGTAYSSKFSPWLAMGSLSPRYVFHEIKQYEQERIKNESTYWLVFELIWRDYFRFIARKHGRSLFLKGGIKGKEIEGKRDWDTFETWKEGNTGVPFVDANMRELKTTGFMSNRGRQNVASFLVKDLELDWRMGAAYFESMLIDYDPCSNWGNWNYVAGVGNDPRPTRYFNVVAQGQRYDPQGAFLRTWLPELQGLSDIHIHVPSKAPGGALAEANITLGKDYPFPMSLS